MIQTNKPTSIRLEKELLKKIRKEAEEEGRSTSKQIEYILRQYYKIKERE